MSLAINLVMSYRTKSQAIGRPKKDPIAALGLQIVGAHMPVFGPPRVCAVCSHVTQLCTGKLKKKMRNKERGLDHLVEVNLFLNSNSSCWVTWQTKTNFL